MKIEAQVEKTTPGTASETKIALDIIWHVIVLNDPVNLMSYVVTVFKRVFGFRRVL